MLKKAIAKPSYFLLLVVLFAPVSHLHAQSSSVAKPIAITGTDPEPTGESDSITGTDPEPTGEASAITGTDPEPTGEPGNGHMLQTFANAALVGLGVS